MFRIVGIDCFHGIDNFVQRSEREKSCIATVISGEAGFLNYDWTTGGEIARGPVAEPARV
jgi:hypothetical protein